MFRLLRESPKDCREGEEEVLPEDSDGGRAGLAVLPVSAFKRSFSAFSISISFCQEDGKHEKTSMFGLFEWEKWYQLFYPEFIILFIKQNMWWCMK